MQNIKIAIFYMGGVRSSGSRPLCWICFS